MKIGVIILFFNNEKEIDSIQFKNIFNQIKNMEVCFVNNGSKDNTLQMLKFIKDENNANIHLLDIKKNIESDAAVRAGARYFYNEQGLNCIGYVDAYKFSDFNNLNKLLKAIENYRNLIINDSLTTAANRRQKIERKSCKKVFSILEKFKNLEIHLDPNTLNYSI